MKTGRNNPCPCGSGKKYKHCCWSPATAVKEELTDLLAEQEFNSIDEVQALAEQFMRQRNQQAVDDFQGLTSEQVHRMLHFPFESPGLFNFPEILPFEPDAPILRLIQWITNAVDEKGLKATAKGNLPQKLCKEAIIDFRSNLPETDYLQRMNISGEDDFQDLHTARVILELSGLLRKTKGRFYLTKKYQQLVKNSGHKKLYPLILKTYCRKFNWGYRDGYEDLTFIQHSFLFSLYLLKLHGNDWKPYLIYGDYFLQAFPMVTEEAMSDSYASAEDQVRTCFDLRVLNRFLHFMGLASIEKIPDENKYSRNFQIRKLPLLDEIVHFSV